MRGWKTYKLSEIAQMIGGGTPKSCDLLSFFELLIFTTTGLYL